MFTRDDVYFDVDGLSIGGWLYIPEGAEGPRPAVTMAHGFTGIKEVSLHRVAEVFAGAGFVVLLHDHPNFGSSEGEPRHDVDPWRQIEAWRQAVTYLQTRPEVDDARIGLWGQSLAGAHAIVLGATDSRPKAVVAQVPHISGIAVGQRRVPPAARPMVERRTDEDQLAQLAGEPPARIKVVSRDPAEAAFYYEQAVVDFYLDALEETEGRWKNDVTVRSSRKVRGYDVSAYVEHVSPTPLLMIVADQDELAPADIALRAYERALEPKRLRLVNGPHFSVANENFDAVVSAASEWFQLHL